MKCPIDQSHLAITERQSIESTTAPDAGARGKLDKIIARSNREVSAALQPTPSDDGDLTEMLEEVRILQPGAQVVPAFPIALPSLFTQIV